MTEQEEKDRARDLLSKAPWIWSKTYAEKAPHWYTLKKQWASQDDFEFVCAVIKKYPTAKKFFKTTFKYFVLEEFQYWTMERPWETAILINRAKNDDYPKPPAD